MRVLRSFAIAGAALAVAHIWTPAASADPEIGLNRPLAGSVLDTQNETAVAVNPNNSKQLVAAAVTYLQDLIPGCTSPASPNNSSTVALYGSNDGGTTWTYSCAPWPPAVTGGLDGADQWYGDDPAVAWGPEGTAYAAYMLASWDKTSDPIRLSSAIVVARTTDAGATWTPWGIVANDITKLFPFHEKPKIAVDTSNGPSSHPGRVYVTWSQDHLERVAWSDDGTTWTKKTFSSPEHLGGNVAVGPDGVVYVVWNKIHPVDGEGQPSSPDSTWLSKSLDGGTTWSTAVKILSHNRGSLDEYYLPRAQDYWWVNSFVSIDINRNSRSPYFNRIHLAWTDLTICCPFGYKAYDIYSSYSADGGASWSSPLLVSDDGDEAAFLPWVAVDQSDGAVHIAWYDTRIDPDVQEQTQVYTARSINGGTSFEKGLCLTDDGSEFVNGLDYSNLNTKTNPYARATQYGDYLGIAAANRKMTAVWTDSRQFFKKNVTPQREDAATGSATYCSAPSWGPSGNGAPTVPAWEINLIHVTLTPLETWGINATGGTPTLLRYSGAGCAGTPTSIQLPAGATSAIDVPPTQGTYSYRVRVRNNCPGTLLTPMTSVSGCSTAVSFTKLAF